MADDLRNEQQERDTELDRLHDRNAKLERYVDFLTDRYCFWRIWQHSGRQWRAQDGNALVSPVHRFPTRDEALDFVLGQVNGGDDG